MQASKTETNWPLFERTFKHVSSFVILDAQTKNVIAKINVKYPLKGEGRMHVFLHVLGHPIQHSAVSGIGFDKLSSGLAKAAMPYYLDFYSKFKSAEVKFIDLLISFECKQNGWLAVITEQNGFIVIQAI